MGLTTRIRVRDGKTMVTWDVPRGFGVDYKWRARSGGPEAELVVNLLGLVGYAATEETVKSWPLRQRVEAEAYAARVHLNAADNGLQSHPRPDWLPEPWKGPEQGEGVFASNPTVLT